MQVTNRTATVVGEHDAPGDVLGFIRVRRADANAADVDVLAAATVWGEQHPVKSIHDAAFWPGTTAIGGETGLALAGEGAPLVAEFCVAELAAALGVSTDSGRILMAHGLELKYRLRRLHRRVTAGEVPVWRARRVAEQTMSLSPEAAAFVDAQVAAFAHSIGPAALDRLVEEAKARFMPDQADADAQSAAERRHVTFHHQQVSFDGTTFVEAELDLADALDLDAALSAGAESLAAAGCGESLDVRRAMAAGDLARRQLALDLDTSDPGQPTGRRPKPRRQVVLYVHLSEAAIEGSGPGIARVENQHRLVTADQVRTWCANPDASVVVKPVIDLAEHIHVEAYEVPDRLAEQTELRDVTCAFPWCARPARTSEKDHVVPHARGGPTCSENIAPLCKRHHRLKTHAHGWTYTVLDPGTYLWTSPHGYQFLRDHTGTTDVSNDRRRPPDH
ncbi:HNH endonuclease signature motif containing protein [Marmoricola sp. URHB0036]|uniref:HNH endonuclease signature motif containing protein n=1 Tax=Marmoricola sp. URHB0036 TaxID=1298863 RepID=UPI000407C38E|nr:HNH endonuclease signature motif containing protein [Marmoricola sp. URHB0036]